MKKTYLDYDYELRDYPVKITRIDANGKPYEATIIQQYYTRVES